MIWTPQNIKKMYEDGFMGAPINPIEQEKVLDEGIVRFSSHIQHLVKNKSGKNKRALLWRSREKFDPGAFGEESQTTGDCTSHGCRNARDVTRSVEIHIKGEPETYYKRGATEPTYSARGHRGQGMDPARAARFVTEYGYMVRENYEGCHDLTTYDSRNGSRYSSPPSCYKTSCKEYPVGEFVRPDTPDDVMALFQSGYAGHSGQNVGFKDDPNSKGIHERSKKGWNHDMATVGYDDTKEIWDHRVYFVVNSWGKHNNQWEKWVNDATTQQILGSPITGMIVVDASVWEKYFLGGRSIYFYSDIQGFPAKNLPNYGAEEFL